MTPVVRSRIAAILRPASPPVLITLVITTLLLFPPGQYSFYPRCPIYELFHVQCPGCGATRAVAALLRGHIVEALRFNAFTAILSPIAAVYSVFNYHSFLHCRKVRWPRPRTATIYAAFAVTAAFTIIRNLPLNFF
jgi:hypothetical protein